METTLVRKEVMSLQVKVAEENCTRSFEQLYHCFYPFLHSFAFRIIKSNSSAQEIVSDVFVQLWKTRSGMKDIMNLKVFLYVAVKNTALNYISKAKKERICWVSEFSEPLPTFLIHDPYLDLEAKELRIRLHNVVNELPPRCKVIFKLIKEDGLKYTEAARVMKLSVKTIENQMGIALKKIARALATR